MCDYITFIYLFFKRLVMILLIQRPGQSNPIFETYAIQIQ